MKRARKNERGQSLVEAAIAIPLVLMLGFNAVNLGYFWFMVLVLSAAPRQAVQYASQGGAAMAYISGQTGTAVQTMLLDNMTNAVGATSSNVSTQICVSANGVVANVATCTVSGPTYSFPAAAADPEAPVYVLQRVDVAYTVHPIIPGGAFNVVLPSNLTFHRQVSMRSLY
ncbi:MAG: TadE/TadG family type IV pilus assembly protein [Terriglobales bacterium]